MTAIKVSSPSADLSIAFTYMLMLESEFVRSAFLSFLHLSYFDYTVNESSGLSSLFLATPSSKYGKDDVAKLLMF